MGRAMMGRMPALAAAAVSFSALSALSGCALWQPMSPPAPAVAVTPAPAAPVLASDGSARVHSDGVEIGKVEFRSGISSATVENLAKAAGCTSSVGAGLVSEPGPVEVYRMACENGKVFLARCELRQCKPM